MRARVLSMLEDAGGWCSGEAIARALQISRAAVAKHVAALRADGNAIAAATRRGYRLQLKREELDEREIVKRLSSRIIGKRSWHMFKGIPSTNSEAARLATGGEEEGTVVFAESQTCGRGRKGKAWLSLPRGLQFSIILRPEAHYWDTELLTLLGAEAVARAIRTLCNLPAKAVLPNDIWIHEKKAGGVLLESAFRGADPEWAVIGIGCNVNALAEDFPQALRQSCTSLLIESGRAYNRSHLLTSVLEVLECYYERMRKGGGDFIKIVNDI